MTVLLDTREIAGPSRSEALAAALKQASTPVQVRVGGRVQAVFEGWDVGAGRHLLRMQVRSPEFRMVRSSRHTRLAGLEMLSVAVSVAGFCGSSNQGLDMTRNDRLRLTDLTSTSDIVQRGPCEAIAFEVAYPQLGVPVDEVRAAMPHLHASPLHDLLHRHLVEVGLAADSLPSAALTSIGSATETLVRSAIRSVSPRRRERQAAWADTRWPRIEECIRHHLGDADLTPATLAAVNHMSLRSLYALFASVGETPSDMIMRFRLEAARSRLRSGDASIAKTAHDLGFKDSSHFSRRFRAAYGVTPREYNRNPASG